MLSLISGNGTPESEQVLIFLHIPKAAGSTLVDVMTRQYGSRAILKLYDSLHNDEFAAVDWSQVNEARVLIGHFYFGLHTLLQRTSTYVTMLRHPVDRVISHYYFVRRDPTHYLYERAQRMTLQAYVEACGRAEPNNDQSRLLAGMRSDLYSAEMLPMAKQHLREHFAVVGLTEEFDRSLLLMKRILGWRTPLYVKQNIAPRRPRKEDLLEETLRVIQAYNEPDIELYDYAKDLLQEQFRLQGESFERELRLFRMLNRSYGQARRLMTASIGNFRVRQT